MNPDSMEASGSNNYRPSGSNHATLSVLDPVLFCIGSVSILGQVILFREWMVAGYGVELICILALGAWMLLNAAGVLLAASGKGPNLSALLFLAGLGSLAGMIFIRSLRILAGLPPGTYLPLSVFIPAVVASQLPLSLFLGAAFQRAADQGILHGRTLARAYAVECAGCVFGSLLSVFMLHWGVQNMAQVLIFAAITMMAGAISARRVPAGSRNSAGSACLLSGIALIALVPVSSNLDQAMTRWNHPDLIECRDSEYGRLTVTRSKGQTVLYQNDVLIADSQSVSAEELAHLVCLQHPDPRKVLVLEGYAEGIAGEAARHLPDQIDQVEIDPALIRLTRKYMTGDVKESGAQVKIFTHILDPRQYLRKDNTFDAIISGCAEPSTALANRFFTRTFFKECEVRLAPGGILGFRLNSSEYFWSPVLAYRNASVVAGLSSVFRHVLVLSGNVNVVLASQLPLVTDPEILIGRYRNRNLLTRLVTPPYLEYILSTDRQQEINRMLLAQDAPPNTDDRPVCYLLSTWIWLSRLAPGMVQQNVLQWIPAMLRYGWIAMLCIMIICAIGIKRLAAGGNSMAYAAAGFAGYCGMVLESAMMLYYQTQSGALYQNMGILFMAFMLGLSAGAVATLNLKNRFGNRFFCRSADSLLLVLPAAAGMGFIWIQGISGPPSLILMAALLTFSGYGVSVIFTRYARKSDHPRFLYAADVAGGGIGALVCGVLFFPLLGLCRTVLLLAGMSVASGIGIALSGRRNSSPAAR